MKLSNFLEFVHKLSQGAETVDEEKVTLKFVATERSFETTLEVTELSRKIHTFQREYGNWLLLENVRKDIVKDIIDFVERKVLAELEERIMDLV